MARPRLLDVRDTGRSNAEYVLLRGLGRWHMFPGDDVGAEKRLARWGDVNGRIPRRVTRARLLTAISAMDPCCRPACLS